MSGQKPSADEVIIRNFCTKVGEMMKAMSVDKLLQKLYDGYESNIHAEILRRFEKMEKYNHKLLNENIRVSNELNATRRVARDGECCGNCTENESRQCPKYDEYRRTGLWTLAWHYCDHYKSDGLTREEREEK